MRIFLNLFLFTAMLMSCRPKVHPDMYAIKAGMTEEKVLELIGKPDSINPRGSTWFYKPDNHALEFYDGKVAVVILDFPEYNLLIGDEEREVKIMDPFVRKFGYSKDLKPGSTDRIVAVYNGNMVDTLDRILVESVHAFSIKGKFFTIHFTRKPSSKYSAMVVDHTFFETPDPNSVHARHADYEVKKSDSLSIAFGKPALNVNTVMPVNLHLQMQMSLGTTPVTLVIDGKALLPVLSQGDFENVWRPLDYLLERLELTDEQLSQK